MSPELTTTRPPICCSAGTDRGSKAKGVSGNSGMKAGPEMTPSPQAVVMSAPRDSTEAEARNPRRSTPEGAPDGPAVVQERQGVRQALSEGHAGDMAGDIRSGE